LVLALGLCCCSGPERSAGVKPVANRTLAPDFELRDADGRTVRLGDYQGKVVLLNFWATWCGPCVIEVPWFIEFERRYKAQGFAVVGILTDEDGWDSFKSFVAQSGINYRVLMGNSTVGELYGGVDALPTTFIIDQKRRIAAVHVGLASKSSYERDLNQLLESGPGTGGARGAGQPTLVARAK
jgi:cytochrome c biogenesis protein CcmG/thiol:disulfide interchange protein DsbE